MNNAQTTNSEMKATVQKRKQRPSMSSSLENTTIQKKPCAALVKGTTVQQKNSGPSVQVIKINTIGHTDLISQGCSWSSQDWLCAYDSVFMSLFHIYCDIGRTALNVDTDLVGKLIDWFDILGQSPTNLFSQQLFNMFWDKFQDKLYPIDLVHFRRHGQVGASVCQILEVVFPLTTWSADSFYLCSEEGCVTWNNNSFSMLTGMIAVQHLSCITS